MRGKINEIVATPLPHGATDGLGDFRPAAGAGFETRLDAVMDQHGEVCGRKRRGQAQLGVVRRATQQRAIVVGRREGCRKEDGGLPPLQRLAQNTRRVEAKQAQPGGGLRIDDGHITLVVEFGDASERVQAKVEFQQILPKCGRLIAGQPSFGFHERGLEQGLQVRGKLAARADTARID